MTGFASRTQSISNSISGEDIGHGSDTWWTSVSRRYWVQRGRDNLMVILVFCVEDPIKTLTTTRGEVRKTRGGPPKIWLHTIQEDISIVKHKSIPI